MRSLFSVRAHEKGRYKPRWISHGSRLSRCLYLIPPRALRETSMPFRADAEVLPLHARGIFTLINKRPYLQHWKWRIFSNRPYQMGCSRRQALGLPRGLSASLVLYHTAQGSRQSWCLLSKCCSCSLLPILGRAATRNCPSLELLMQRQCPDGFFFQLCIATGSVYLCLYTFWIQRAPLCWSTSRPTGEVTLGRVFLDSFLGKGIFCTFCAEPGATIHHQRSLWWGRPDLKNMQIKVNLLELLWCKKMSSSDTLSSWELRR